MDLAVLIGPIVGAFIVVLGWYRLHKDASKRDLENWRRTTLATAVTELIATAEEMVQMDVDIDNDDEMKEFQAKYAVLDQKLAMINMCDPLRIWSWANSYKRGVEALVNVNSLKNKNCEWEIGFRNAERNYLHSRTGLTEQLAISVGLQPEPPHDPNRAYVIHSVPRTKPDILKRKLLRRVDNFFLRKEVRQPWTRADELKEERY